MPEPVEITLRVDRGRIDELELDTLIAMEEGRLSARAMRDLLATYMVDPATNEYMARDRALTIIGRARVADLARTLEQFVERLQEAALPPGSGGES